MIEQDDKYSVGISKIDDEHKQFIDIINEAIATRELNDDPGLDQLNCEIDLLLISYTYFHYDEPVKYFREKVYPYIQDKTVVAIADMAPVPGQARHTIPAQQVIAEMAEAGFKIDEEPTTLLDQYLLVFKKPTQQYAS